MGEGHLGGGFGSYPLGSAYCLVHVLAPVGVSWFGFCFWWLVHDLDMVMGFPVECGGFGVVVLVFGVWGLGFMGILRKDKVESGVLSSYRSDGGKKSERLRSEVRQLVVQMLSNHYHDWQIKRILKVQYGYSDSAIKKAIADGKRLLLERLGRDYDEMRSESLAFYESVIRNPEASLSAKMEAQRCIDTLLGLNAPHKIEARMETTSTVSVNVNVVHERLMEFRRAYQELFSGGGGGGVSGLLGNGGGGEVVEAGGGVVGGDSDGYNE